jgi:hypothetical protein
VRQLALLVVADVQPLQNTGPLAYLRDPPGLSEASTIAGTCTGFGAGSRPWKRTSPAIRRRAVSVTATHRHWTDACVAPQLANARRAGLPFDDRPTLDRIHGACRPLPAFQRGAPERQPDAPSG